MGISYRADIDGLRAIAVVAIILYHLRVSVFTGGFVGVDVFFVISGFLIGGQIFAAREAGNFSLTDFYRRRLRRILPALLLVLLATSAAALAILYPAELQRFGRSLVASALSIANIYFWQESGYFALGLDDAPLLHIWSLGVEEQFYLLFPALILALARLPRARMTLALAVIGGLSLGLAAVGVRIWPEATFFLLPGRAWELLLGALLARTEIGLLDRRWRREAAALAGIAMIGIPALIYHSRMPFPGLAAIPPCAGAALVIAAGRSGPTLVNRALALRPFVFVGLISYSLYLWHWPILTLIQQGLPVHHLSRVDKLAAVALTFGLATASWYFVERPFRRPGISARTIFAGSGAGVAVVTVLGLALVATAGLPQRFDPRALRALDARIDWEKHYRRGPCYLVGTPFDRTRCAQPSATRPDVMILGDSHAAHLWWGLHARYPQVNFMQATSSGCVPVLEHEPSDWPGCVALIDETLRAAAPGRPDLLIIAAAWSPANAPPLKRTLQALRARGVNVAVVGPTLRFDVPLPKLLALATDRSDPGIVARQRMRDPALEQAIRAASIGGGAQYLSVQDWLCRSGSCITTDPAGRAILWDGSHLTAEGSIVAAEAFEPLIAPLLALH